MNGIVKGLVPIPTADSCNQIHLNKSNDGAQLYKWLSLGNRHAVKEKLLEYYKCWAPVSSTLELRRIMRYEHDEVEFQAGSKLR